MAIGGAFGAVARYLVNELFFGIFVLFPLATFLINISGCFLIGLLFVLAVERTMLGEYWKLIFIVGFLGAYTTFSTFELENWLLVRERNLLLAAIYTTASVLIGFLAVAGGVFIGRKF